MGVISYRNRSKGRVNKQGRPLRPSWEYRFYGATVRGKRICFSKAGFQTKQEAVTAGVKAYNEYMNTGTVFKDVGISYTDVLDSWMENYVRIRCAPATIANYENMINNHIRPAFGCYHVTAIQHESIQVFINRLFDEGYARATLVNLLALLSCSLRYAKRQRWIQFNPAEDIDLPTTRACVNQRHKVREPVPREVMQKIFERFPEGSPVHLPFMLAYHCGLRLGEVFGLTWKDVDLEQGRLVVNQQMQWRTNESKYQLTPPKYDSTRRVMLDPVILDLLKRTREQQLERRNHYGTLHVRNFIDRYGYLNQNGDGEEMEFLMVREDGTFLHRTVIDHASKVIKRELGHQQFDFHSLRHTHATELSEYGVNLKEIQRRLGHKTLEVTVRTYIHATDVMEAESMQIMKQMYGTT